MYGKILTDQLVTDVKSLQGELDKPDFQFETRMFVQGPQALIDEVAKTKVNGEEDRYSHTDLWDFAANLDGSETLIADLQPVITVRDQALMDKITTQFADVRKIVDGFRRGDGYASYTEVNEDTRKDISAKIDALSATLSQIPGLVLEASPTQSPAPSPGN